MSLKLRYWPNYLSIEIVADMSMKEAMEHFLEIGCVYPSIGDSFYIDSNIQDDTIYCKCKDGGFYGVYKGDIFDLPRIPEPPKSCRKKVS